MREQLFTRTPKGNRWHYKPAGIHWAETMPAGSHLLQVTPNADGFTMTAYRHDVEPDRAAVLAAIMEFQAELVKTLQDNFRKTLESPPMNKKQREAWQRFEQETGICSVMLSGPDAWAAARKAADMLASKLDKTAAANTPSQQ